MKRYIFPVVITCSTLFLLSACGTTSATTPSTDTASTTDTTTTVDALKNSQPQKQADIQGTVKSIVGNDFTIETIDMSSSDILKEAQSPDFRTKMQTMSDADRQKFFTDMQAARASAKKVLIDVTVPVGVPILVRTGGGGGGGGRAGGGFGGGRPGGGG